MLGAGKGTRGAGPGPKGLVEMQEIFWALLETRRGSEWLAAWRGEEPSEPSWLRRHPAAVILAELLLMGAVNAALGTH